MFSNSCKLLVSQLSKKSQKSFSTIKSLGSLYTWGNYTSGTGFKLSNQDPNINVPKRVEQFDGKVSKVVMGPYHSCVVTGEGELWTMGSGKYGALGHEEGHMSSYEPKQVQYFADNNIKVVDAVCGEQVTIVVADNGDLYSFGYGGTYDFQPMDWLNPRTGALGSGLNKHRLQPQKIEGVSKVSKLSAGDNFAIAVGEKGQVINWGCGADGSLADGLCEGVLTPQVNENFQLLAESGITVKEIKSAGHFSVALLSDGNLYAWGRNNQGSMGIRENLGHVTDQVATLPTKVVNNYFKDQKIVDFSVGENSLIILTDKNQVYWSGIDLAYKPIQWDIPTDKKIKKIVASKDCFAALTEDGQIYGFNEYVSNARHRPGNDYSTIDKSAFGNQNVVEIGGSYGIRYAITQ